MLSDTPFAGEPGTHGAVIKHAAPRCYFDLVGIASLRAFFCSENGLTSLAQNLVRKKEPTPAVVLVFRCSDSVAPEMRPRKWPRKMGPQSTFRIQISRPNFGAPRVPPLAGPDLAEAVPLQQPRRTRCSWRGWPAGVSLFM